MIKHITHAVIVISFCLFARNVSAVTPANSSANEEPQRNREQKEFLEIKEWCYKLKVSDEDRDVLYAILLAHKSSGLERIAKVDNSPLALACWMKSMRYFYDRPSERPLMPNYKGYPQPVLRMTHYDSLLDYIIAWYDEIIANYTEIWTPTVKMFLQVVKDKNGDIKVRNLIQSIKNLEEELDEIKEKEIGF